MTTHQLTIDSPLGPLRLLEANDELIGLYLPETTDQVPVGIDKRSPVLDLAARQLDEYFAQQRRVFDLPIVPRGSGFQERVWRALLDIPFGQTWSYGQLAKHIGRPSASRAVGTANGANPISIIVPCHRVIGANGTLTGYGGGLPAKRWLLAHEGAPGATLDLWAGCSSAVSV